MCRLVKKIIGLVFIGYLSMGMVFADENSDLRFTGTSACSNDDTDVCLENWLESYQKSKQPYWDSFVLWE